MKKLFARFDSSVFTEVIGLTCVAIGIGMIFIPASLIVVGAFLIWITEKAN